MYLCNVRQGQELAHTKPWDSQSLTLIFIENGKSNDNIGVCRVIFNRFSNQLFSEMNITPTSMYEKGLLSCSPGFEPKSGKTKVTINNKPYSKMTAAEKREALEFVNTISFEVVVDHDLGTNEIQEGNWLTGTFTEGQVINVCGSDIPWRKIEKVTKIQ